MRIIETVILGIVQGIAEFLPISSSAHLIIFRDIFGIGSFLTGEYEMCFDIALHFGTFLAIIVYFFKEFWEMVINGIRIIFAKKKMDKEKQEKGLMLWKIAVATVPAAFVGYLFEDKVEDLVRGNYVLIAICLAIMGIIIYYCDKIGKTNRNMEKITFKDAILIGCAQVGALIPGFSRSGTTISMARALKLDRSTAAKFSFYLSLPIVFGAVFLKALKGKMIDLIVANPLIFGIGIVISFVSGLLCIKFLLKYIKKHDYKIFMWYRLIMALLVLIILYLK